MDELFEPLLELLDREAPGKLVGVYLYGSAVSSRLRADSDIDLLMLTRRSLTQSERAALVSTLLVASGWKGHANTFPDAARRRPIELTSIVQDEVQKWAEWPQHDFQYGEWLRAELIGGSLPQPATDPDSVILIATAISAHRVLRGPALEEVVSGVPLPMLRRAVINNVPNILHELEGDERNTVLTLARSIVTLDTGKIVSKDEAVDVVAPMLAKPDRALLEHAKAGYLGIVDDNWTGLNTKVASLAEALATIAEQYGTSS